MMIYALHIWDIIIIIIMFYAIWFVHIIILQQNYRNTILGETETVW